MRRRIRFLRPQDMIFWRSPALSEAPSNVSTCREPSGSLPPDVRMAVACDGLLGAVLVLKRVPFARVCALAANLVSLRGDMLHPSRN